MEVHVGDDLRGAVAVVLHDVVVGVGEGDVREDSPEDAAGDQGEEPAQVRGGAGGEVGELDVVVSWGDEHVAAGEGRDVEEGDDGGGREDYVAGGVDEVGVPGGGCGCVGRGWRVGSSYCAEGAVWVGDIFGC